MVILTIDCRPNRLRPLTTWLRTLNVSVFEAPKRRELAIPEGNECSLVLLHVGRLQGECDNLAAVIEEYISKGAFILGYGGGQISAGVGEKVGPQFAIFPFPVALDRLDEDLKKVIAAIVRELSSDAIRPNTWFKDTVTKFDPVLERKLEVLASVLSGVEPEGLALSMLRRKGIDTRGNIDLTNPKESAANLRKLFFVS